MGNSEQHWVVIPATGIGQRMNASRPKQYLELSGKSILEHTLDNLLAHPEITGAILILNSQDSFWEKLQYQHTRPVLLCTGGEQRHHSVFNGLKRLLQHTADNPYVLIHDAVRPFVSHLDITNLIAALHDSKDGALLATPVSDTLKLANPAKQVTGTQPRNNLWRAFTPQAFRLNDIYTALENVINNNLEVTDDASAMELSGASPRLVEGASDNIKITTPQDLLLAEKILSVNR